MMKKLFLILPLLTLAACGMETEVKERTASQIARPAFMVERFISAGQFNLKAWERMHSRGQNATIYIEGDSVNEVGVDNKYIAMNLPGINSTPKSPIGLMLASRDKSKNLAYLARPCQYVKFPTEKGCGSEYWQERRFTPEVIKAYEIALDDIKARYDVTGFDIVGFDGGANIAAILAGRRPDIMTLRTVAGNLNPDFVTDHTGHRPLASDSVMAIDYGTVLARVPQHHFIGGADTVITPGVYHSYRQNLGLSDCIHYSLVRDADHTSGWVQRWPELLEIRPSCGTAQIIEEPQMPAPSNFLPPPRIPNRNLNKGPVEYSK